MKIFNERRKAMCGKLIYKCTNLHCGIIYKEEHHDELKGDEITGGFCPICVLIFEVQLIRVKQKKEGNPDCFAKSSGCCDRFD